MKVMIVNNSSFTPVKAELCCETKTGKFAVELKALGCDVTMYGQVVEQDNIHAFNPAAQDVRVVGYKRKNNKLFNYLSLYLLAIPNIVRSDFIYIFYPSAFKYISFLCWLLRKPYGLYLRGERGAETLTSRWIYKKAHVVFTVADRFSKMVNDVTSKNNAFTIRPMIDLTSDDVVSHRKYSTRRHYKVLFLARLEEDKGVREFLLAVGQLRGRGYMFSVDLVGGGNYFSRAVKLVQELDLGDMVSVKGVVLDPAELRDIYIGADIYVLPTYHEGFPRTLYEAMIYGTPIITTFVGGIPGVMVDKHNCIEIKPRSIESIVEQLAFALDNYLKMVEYAHNGFETVARIVDSTRLTHAEHLNSMLRSACGSD